MKSIIKTILRLFSIIFPIVLGLTIIAAIIGDELFQGLTPSIQSFALLHFLAYLFFFMMPIEAVFFAYLFLGYNFIVLFIIAIPISLVSETIDYYIGFILSKKIISYCHQSKEFSKTYIKSMKYISKYGGLAIFVFSLLPLSSPIMMFTAGILKYKYKKAILYTTAGLMLKYLGIAIIYAIWVIK